MQESVDWLVKLMEAPSSTLEAQGDPLVAPTPVPV